MNNKYAIFFISYNDFDEFGWELLNIEKFCNENSIK